MCFWSHHKDYSAQPLQLCSLLIGISVDKIGKILPLWQNLKVFGQLLKVYFVLGKILNLLWANVMCYWAKVHCCKWPNIEKTI